MVDKLILRSFQPFHRNCPSLSDQVSNRFLKFWPNCFQIAQVLIIKKAKAMLSFEFRCSKLTICQHRGTFEK